MLSDELLDDNSSIKCEASAREVVQKFGKLDLRNFEKKVDILSEPGAAADSESKSADERVAHRSGLKRLRHGLHGSHRIARQLLEFSVHGVR